MKISNMSVGHNLLTVKVWEAGKRKQILILNEIIISSGCVILACYLKKQTCFTNKGSTFCESMSLEKIR